MDCVGYGHVTSLDCIKYDLEAICVWAAKWLVTYNHTKTEQVTYSRKKDMARYHKENGLNKDGSFNPGPVPCPHPSLSFSGAVVPQSPQVKIVGLTISYNLTWGTHIMNIHRKANRCLAMLRRARRVLSPPALSTIYKSYISSRVTNMRHMFRQADSFVGDINGWDLSSLNHDRNEICLTWFQSCSRCVFC